jgi:hypothetical protein
MTSSKDRQIGAYSIGIKIRKLGCPDKRKKKKIIFAANT